MFDYKCGTKHITEKAEFGSKKDLIRALGYKDECEIDNIQSYVWGYNLNHGNIVPGSVIARKGIQVDECCGILTMSYDMLFLDDKTYEIVEYDVNIKEIK